MTKWSSVMLSLSGSEIGYKQAVEDTAKAIRESGAGLDLNTKRGRDNQQALNAQAAAANAYIAQLKEAGAGSETLAAKTASAQKALVRVARAAGMSADEARAFAAAAIAVPDDVAPTFSTPGAVASRKQAQDMARAVHAIPSAASTRVLAPGARPSRKEVQDFMQTVKGVPKEKRTAIETIARLGGVNAAKAALASLRDKTFTVTTIRREVTRSTGKGNNIARAYGGPLPGYAPHDRADNVIYAGTPGEWVIQRPTARYYGADVMAKFNAGHYPREVLQRLAFGGPVATRWEPAARDRVAAYGAAPSAGATEVNVAFTGPIGASPDAVMGSLNFALRGALNAYRVGRG